jgi:hypothetical protein
MRASGDETARQMSTHVQREARRVLIEVIRAQRCLARCLARVDETKATEAGLCEIRHQSILVERMIEAFNAVKSDAELSAAMQLVVRLTALDDVASMLIAKERRWGSDSISTSNCGVVEVFRFEKEAPSEPAARVASARAHCG